MELTKAQIIAEEVKSKLAPFCANIEIAGSIRRKKPYVHDIDLVVIPNNQGQFIYAVQQLGKIKMGGQKLIRCEMQTIGLDVYIATTDTWATLLLIRTGSARHNVILCTRARQMGMKLHADGSGLTKNGDKVAGDTEESIFEALGMKYKKPEERE